MFALGIGYYFLLLCVIFWVGRGRLEYGEIREPLEVILRR